MPVRRLTVFIYLPGETTAVPAGIFTHDDDAGIGAFAYGRRYLDRGNALPVDPIALPLGLRPREITTNGGLYGAFRDASPDYWGRIVIAAEAGTAPEALSEIDFLVAANATRVGNIDFRLSSEDPEPALGPPHFDQLANIIDVAGKIEAHEPVETHLLQILRQGTSMGGARPKCVVEWNDALWIAKFPAKDDSLDIPRIEYATMTLARRCGIQIPDTHLMTIGNRNVFLIRRFDREKGDGGWLRTGFLSALSLMQWDERDRQKWDYTAIADTMRRHTPPSDLRELYRRMIFNIFVRNTDDHPRNHAFLVEKDGSLRLSPAYDIVPSLTQPGVGTQFRLAMSVGAHGREATPENALSRAARFGLSGEEAGGVIASMAETVSGWQDHFRGCGIPKKECDILRASFRGTSSRTSRGKA